MSNAGNVPNFVAASTILPYSCVKSNTSNPFRAEAATAEADVVIGVTDGSTRAFDSVNQAIAGDVINLQNGEFLQMRAGGSIAIGDGLRPTTGGAVITATSRTSFVAAEAAAVNEVFWAKRVGAIEAIGGGLEGVTVAGVAANGLNYTFNSSVNSISASTGSNANTIAGGGNSANPNLLLNAPGEATCAYRTIGGGYDNVIGSTNAGDGAIASTQSGGTHGRIRRPVDVSDNPNPALDGIIVIPIAACFTLDEPDHGTIGGGGYQAIRNGNYGVIAGGASNAIMGEDATYNLGSAATIAGGQGHWVSGNNATIGGGLSNRARQIYGTIAGGVNNIIMNISDFINNSSTIAGGSGNEIYNADGGTIAGGKTNKIGASSDGANDRGLGSAISGGVSNTIGANTTTARYAGITSGQLNTVNTWWATVLGGYNNLVSPSSFPNGEYSVAMGRDAECQHHMTVCQGGGIFAGAVRGSAQTQTTVLKVSTANATVTALATGGGPANAGELSMPSDCLWGFRVMVVGRQTNANTNCAWEITGLATNDAGTAAIVGTPTVTNLATVPTGWGSPTVTVTGSSTRLFFNVTGHATNTIRWVASAEITQVIA